MPMGVDNSVLIGRHPTFLILSFHIHCPTGVSPPSVGPRPGPLLRDAIDEERAAPDPETASTPGVGRAQLPDRHRPQITMATSTSWRVARATQRSVDSPTHLARRAHVPRWLGPHPPRPGGLSRVERAGRSTRWCSGRRSRRSSCLRVALGVFDRAQRAEWAAFRPVSITPVA